MSRLRCIGALLALTLLPVALIACGGAGPGSDGNGGTPSGPTLTTLDGRIVVPSEFLEDTTLADLMDSARVWLVDRDGEFVLSVAPNQSGAFTLQEVPAGVAGQRLMAIFGSGDEALSLETLLGPLPQPVGGSPAVQVNITLASTVQAEMLRDPELAEQLRIDVLGSLPGAARAQLSTFALKPLDLEDGTNMLTIVSDTSSLAGEPPMSSGMSRLADECVWSNPLSWLNCWTTPDLQVQNGGRTSNTVRRPEVPRDHVLGLEFQSTTAARIIAAGGGNIIATGGGNIIATGGGNIIAAGGGNIIATGGGNIISTGGGNVDGASRLGRDGDVRIVRRVDFGDVLEPGEIGELRRFGPQIHSDFVIVPASLFDEYTAREVAFIAKNISWAGDRGREAAERIIADARAREAAAAEFRSAYSRAAASPPITLPSEARQHAAPRLVYVDSAAGQAALSAPVIVAARIPATDPTVVEITARNVTSGMQAYWRAPDGGYEEKPLLQLDERTFRVALSANGYGELLIAAPGPVTPYSNLVNVAVEPGGATTPAVNVLGLEGIGGQGGRSIDFVVEDAAGELLIADMQKTILHLPAGTDEWTSLSAGLSESLSWNDRRLLTMGPSADGELYALLEGQAYRLRSTGVWEPYGPELRDPSDYLICRYGSGGLVDRDGGIYQLDRCADTYYLYYLDPSGSSWNELFSDTLAVDGPMHLGGDGNIYLPGRKSSFTSQVLHYKPGDRSFSVVPSPTDSGERAVQLSGDDAGNLLLLAELDDDPDGLMFRVYLRTVAGDDWQPIEMTLPHADFYPTSIARPRADGPLYAVAEGAAEAGFFTGQSLYRLEPGTSTWVEETEPAFVLRVGDYSYGGVEEIWPGQNGSLLVLAADMLFRRESPTAEWENLSRGLSGDGGPFAFLEGEVLLGSNFSLHALDHSHDAADEYWRRVALEEGVYGAQLFFDPHNRRAYATHGSGEPLFERIDGGWRELGAFPATMHALGSGAAADGTLFILSMEAGAQQVRAFDGEEWRPIGDPTDSLTTITVSEEGDVYGGGYEGVRVLRAGESEWQALGYLSRGGSRARRLALAPDGALYGSWEQHGVSRFAAGADEWETINDGLPSSNGSAVTVHDLAIDGSGAVFGATDFGVYRLPPDGVSWEGVPGLVGVAAKSLGIGSDNRLYVSTGEPGVFRSLP